MSDLSRPGLSWNWSLFGLGACFAIPSLIVTPFQPSAGLALAIGVLPAAAFPLPPTRRARAATPLVGAISGAALLLGSVLTSVPAVAVAALFVLAIVASLAATRSRLGMLALVLGLPMTGIGLSFEDVRTTALMAVCIVGGSVFAWLLALLWPEHPQHPTAEHRSDSRAMLGYGILLGAAGATAATIGYLLHLEHVGWATGAALLVMRPVRDQLVLRSIGRATSVLVGALTAAVFALANPSPLATAIAVALVLASLAATQQSRWYITPGFTTFIALTLMLQGQHGTPLGRLLERSFETLLGIALALVFGALVPAAVQRWRDHRRPGGKGDR